MKTVCFVGLVLLSAACRCRDGAAVSAPLRKIDVHTHLSPGALGHLLPLLEKQGIDTLVNLSGHSPGRGLEQQLQAAATVPGSVIVFCTPDFSNPGQLADQLAQMQGMGCRGVKIYKALGLQIQKPDGTLLAVDDPSLDPLFDKAGALGMPVAIHTGDPKAFWLPVDEHNERLEELTVHPDWAEYGRPVPSWAELLEQFEHRVARHPGTNFIGLHFGNAAEEPERVDAMLDRYPNLFVETGARIPELGRAPPQKLKALFLKHQTRIMFGTDLGAGDRPGQLVLGSPGRAPPTPADVDRFFSASWRFFETFDRGFPHPTAIQGSWAIDGIGLPREVLQKIYRDNAVRVLGLRGG